MFSPKLINTVLVFSLLGTLSACGNSSTKHDTKSSKPDTSTIQSPGCFDQTLALDFIIQALPKSTGQAYKKAFCKYMSIEAPNGKHIELFAQSEISNDQLIRAHNILSFYL